MKFGVREICNVVFRAASAQTIGNKRFEKGQPVFYLDSAKTSSMEGSATTVYAQGGRGNARLIAWEGERTLTFTVEDALLSPVSFAMLSGAGVVKGQGEEAVHFHQTTMAVADADGIIDLSNALETTDFIDTTAPLFVMTMDEGGDIKDTLIGKYNVVEADDDTIDRKRLQYGDKADLTIFNSASSTGSGANINYSAGIGSVAYNSTTYEPDVTGYNGKHSAYAFPYTINSNHAASREAVQGWNNAIAEENYLLNGYPVFAEPVPTSLLVNTSTTTTYLPEEIWTVVDFHNKPSFINLPPQLASPTFTIPSGETVDPTVYFVPDTPGAVTAGSTYKILTKDDTTNWPTGSGNNPVSGNVLRKVSYDKLNINKPLSSVYIKEVNTSTGEMTGSAIKGKLQGYTKAKILADYFGVPVKFQGNKISPATEDAETDVTVGNTTFKVTSTYSNKTKADLRYQRAKRATDAYNAYMTTANKPVMVDYYVIKKSATVTELQIDASNFGGYYYVEADTLFRRQIDGKDMPANLTFPNVKIQSNFTFSMAATGDPSTFTFTMDAFPGYTYFDKTRKVLCAIQIVDDVGEKLSAQNTVFPHVTESDLSTEISRHDSSPDVYDEILHSKLGTVEYEG